MFVGRRRELGALRSAFDARTASVSALSGPVGVGKSALVGQVTKGVAAIVHRCPPLPDPSQRAALAATLASALPALGRGDPDYGPDRAEGSSGRAPAPAPTRGPDHASHPVSHPPHWPDLLRAVERAGRPEDPPLVLVLDDAHRLAESRTRLGRALTELMASCRGGGRPVHVLLVGRAGALPAGGDPEELALHLRLTPLTFRSALPLLPGAGARDKLAAYGVFGGSPGTLRHVDAGASLAGNVRRLLLSPDGALTEAGTVLLERHLQTPSRYAAILAALSGGEAEWGAIHAGVSDVTTSGQVAPYLSKLEELGLIEVRRSLDARPRSRSRRYRIVDPFLAFWFRLAVAAGWAPPRGEEALGARAIRDVVQAQATSIFAEVCRQYMLYDVMELLGQNARECGGLWGAHYDMEVSGMLSSGAAFYGTTSWSEPASPAHLRRLDKGVRETRYGFGRESRLRVVFTAADATPQLARAAARRHEVVMVTVADLAGTAA